MDIETVFAGSGSAGDSKGELGAVRRGDHIDGTRVGEGVQTRRAGEELSIGAGNQFGGDGEIFAPGVVAVFFNGNLVAARIEVEGVVGGGC